VQEFVNYTFSGLTTAAIFAIAASGLVVLYTTTGVFNFAHGAMGMVAAFRIGRCGSAGTGRLLLP
jgi:branched-chain amino acid transport system permease protein